MPIVPVPGVSLWSRDAGIRRLVSALSPCWHTEGDVSLDLAGCDFLSAEAVAVLAGFTALRRSRGFATILLPGISSYSLRKNLWKMGFLELFGQRSCPFGTNSLPIHIQARHDRTEIVGYLEREVMSGPEMPDMSVDLRREIRRSFVEILGNVFSHSESAIGGLVCGQVYPRRGEIQLTFFDVGVGIGHRVRSCHADILDDAAAIRWALERGTSTLATSVGYPRGLGLYLLRDFLRVNDGELQVYANSGYYREYRGEAQAVSLEPPLLGTLIDLRIRVQSDVSYLLADEA